MATGPDLSSSSAADAAGASAAAKKDRHIVSWSAEEDDVLRAQIAHHGTENWTVIATQFKDKTARQCRRRWYNYLNTECKKGGWSREEDMLLCEAQKLLGNKWTEIAKVVSGRTDNAVKNRFSTLCKRRANNDDPFEENGAVCSNANAKRVLTQTGDLTCGAPSSSPPIKNIRSCKPEFKENVSPHMRSFGQEKSVQQDSRQPLANICPDNKSVNIVETPNLVTKTSTKQLHSEEQRCVKHEGNFLKKNDPKFATLLQQADLLSSLATKVNTENTSQSMDEAWQKLQHHLVKKDDNAMSESSISGTPSLLEDLDDLIVDPYENEEEDESKSGEQNGVTSEMAPDHIMDNCPVDQSTEDDSLCGITLSSCMKPSPGAEILAYVNSDEAAGDGGFHCMEYSSPEQTALQAKADEEIPACEDLSVAAEGSWSQFMEYISPAHAVLHAKEDTEIPASVNLSEAAEARLPQCVEYMSPAHTLLPTKTDPEIPASVNLSGAAEGILPQCTEYMSPADTLLPAKIDPEIPASIELSEAAKDGSLQCTEYTSPAHTDLQELSMVKQITCQLLKLLPVRRIFCCLCSGWPHPSRSQTLLSSLLAKGLFLTAFERGIYIFYANTFCILGLHGIEHQALACPSACIPWPTPLDLILTRVALPTSYLRQVCLAHVIVQLFVRGLSIVWFVVGCTYRIGGGVVEAYRIRRRGNVP